MSVQRFIPIVADLKQEFLSESLEHLVSRPEEAEIDLGSKLAQVVIGVRRCGKSTLCRKVLREAKVKAAYINFDDERLADLATENLNEILEATYFVYGDFDYLLLDEIQNVDCWPLFVNRLLRQNLHLIITGSNAKLLSNELMTHLTGRHHKIELYPFSFKDFAEAKKVDLNSLTTKGIAEAKRCLDEYLFQGGFPELLAENDRRDYIAGLFEAIIKRDISLRFKIRYPEILYKLASYCVDNFAREISTTKLADEFGVSSQTISTYLNYLKEAFLLLNIPKFSYKSIERIRPGKYYVIDNAFVSERDNSFAPKDLGWRLENTILIELYRRAAGEHNEIFFYKDKTFEIDFVVTQYGKVRHLIQVCLDIDNEKTRQREIKALTHGRKKFNCTDLTLITFHNDETVTIDADCSIKIISAVNWLNA